MQNSDHWVAEIVSTETFEPRWFFMTIAPPWLVYSFSWVLSEYSVRAWGGEFIKVWWSDRSCWVPIFLT